MYCRSQRPRFQAAARGYDLHWAFAQGPPLGPAGGGSYEDMVKWRFSALLENLRRWGRDDLKIERDKCKMYSFFQRNGMPTAPILYTSAGRGLDGVLDDIRSDRLFANVSRWPVFLKSCHITIGTADGVLRLRGRARAANGSWQYDARTTHGKVPVTSLEQLLAWVSAKWSAKAVDTGRAWQEAADLLSADLEPGMILQGPARLSPPAGPQKKAAMYEVKTYVQWGRAFLGMLLRDGDPTGDLLLRGRTDTGMELAPADGVLALFYLHRIAYARQYRWLVDEGHGACLWPLAERAARAMKIDEVRIDIFITRGQPHLCAVNEISLSSGIGQGPYRMYIAKLWAAPHIARSYKVWGSATSEPIYRMAPPRNHS